MADDLYVKVSRELYEKRAEFNGQPVTVSMSEPNEDGEVEMMFTSHSKLWLVTGDYWLCVVRAHTEEQAREHAWNDQLDVEGDIRCSAEEYFAGRETGRTKDDVLTATELSLQGVCGVLGEHSG